MDEGLKAEAERMLNEGTYQPWQVKVDIIAAALDERNRLRQALADREAEVAELRGLVEEWLCVKCRTVYPGPPRKGLACVICPKCEGETGPRYFMEHRDLRQRLEAAERVVEAAKAMAFSHRAHYCPGSNKEYLPDCFEIPLMPITELQLALFDYDPAIREQALAALGPGEGK